MWWSSGPQCTYCIKWAKSLVAEFHAVASPQPPSWRCKLKVSQGTGKRNLYMSNMSQQERHVAYPRVLNSFSMALALLVTWIERSTFPYTETRKMWTTVYSNGFSSYIDVCQPNTSPHLFPSLKGLVQFFSILLPSYMDRILYSSFQWFSSQVSLACLLSQLSDVWWIMDSWRWNLG